MLTSNRKKQKPKPKFICPVLSYLFYLLIMNDRMNTEEINFEFLGITSSNRQECSKSKFSITIFLKVLQNYKEIFFVCLPKKQADTIVFHNKFTRYHIKANVCLQKTKFASHKQYLFSLKRYL